MPPSISKSNKERTHATKKIPETKHAPTGVIKLSDPFQNQVADENELRAFGFTPCANGYCYTSALLGGLFEMTITIDNGGSVGTRVLDADTKEEYILHKIPTASGAFVGAVRQAHDELLSTVKQSCFHSSFFRHPQTLSLIDYVHFTYGALPEFLWGEGFGGAVWRKQETGKWYGVLMKLSRRKLGMNSDEMVEILDLHATPADVSLFLNNPLYLPGYHMNKQRWYTIVLDGTFPTEDLCRHIDVSFLLATKK